MYSAPAAASWGPGRIDIFALGGNRALWHKAADSSSTPQPPPWPWGEWEDLGGSWTDGVGVSSWAANRLDCFTVGTDRALWHKVWNGSTWSAWESLGGEIYSAPAAVCPRPDRIDIFALGGNRQVLHKWYAP